MHFLILLYFLIFVQLTSLDAEFKILSKASSEWIVDLKYSFQDPKRLYFVQEYVSDEDLLVCIER